MEKIRILNQAHTLSTPEKLVALRPATLKLIKERQRLREISRPNGIKCRKCNKVFFPEWNEIDEKWTYPEMTEKGICVRCSRLIHIKKNIKKCLESAGVPPKYLGCSFENFKVTKENHTYFSACKKYASAPNGGLFLYGSYGTGKTHMAAAIARELLLRGEKVAFTSTPKLLFQIRKSFQKETEEEEQYISPYISCRYLVLDDFGMGKVTEWTRQTLAYIVCERDDNMKPTIVTSNLSLDEIAEKIDGRISSRLAGMGRVIQFKGRDYRLRRRPV